MTVLSDVMHHVNLQKLELSAGMGFVEVDNGELILYIGMSTFDSLAHDRNFYSVYTQVNSEYAEFMGIQVYRVETGSLYLAHLCWRPK